MRTSPTFLCVNYPDSTQHKTEHAYEQQVAVNVIRYATVR